jgi:hypothetical protein
MFKMKNQKLKTFAPLINTLLQQRASATHAKHQRFQPFTSSALKSQISNLKLSFPIALRYQN